MVTISTPSSAKKAKLGGSGGGGSKTPISTPAPKTPGTKTPSKTSKVVVPAESVPASKTPAPPVKTPSKTPGKTPSKTSKVVVPEPKVPTTTTTVPDLDPTTFVTKSKLQESLSVVAKLQTQHEASETTKKALFDQDSKFVHLQVELKKVPLNFSTYIHAVPLPRHWRHQLDQETCLIVSDLNKVPLTDRDLDLEQTKGKYFDLLEAGNATELVKDILPIRQLRNEFRPKALKYKLASQYSTFLCDRKLLRNKNAFLPRFLGKAFWIERKRVPVPVDLECKASELRPQLETALNLTHIYVSGKGSTLSILIGTLEQSQAHLLENLTTVLGKLQSTFASNVRSLSVKTEKGQSVMFYMDLGSSNEIKLVHTGSRVDKKQFVEDEFDFLANSNVRVYNDGKIQVLSKSGAKKRKLIPEDDENSNDQKEELDEPELGEIKFIRTMNRSFARGGSGDHDWVRHKVSNLHKTTRSQLRRLPGGVRSRILGKKKRTSLTGSGPASGSKKRFFSKANANKKDTGSQQQVAEA